MSAIDYRVLLIKYLSLVQAEEGYDFLDRVWERGGVFQNIGGDVEFTSAELETLESLAAEALATWNTVRPS